MSCASVSLGRTRECDGAADGLDEDVAASCFPSQSFSANGHCLGNNPGVARASSCPAAGRTTDGASN
eukprot:3507265-Amphidinium_carterae.1